MSILGAALISIFVLIGALHLYWGFGGRWPGHNEDSLRLLVSGVKSGPMYGLGPCAAVALALGAAAGIVVARHSAIVTSPFAWVVIAGYVVLILVFFLRGAAPYVSPVFEYARGTPFFGMNRLYYAPLCLGIAAALIANFPR